MRKSLVFGHFLVVCLLTVTSAWGQAGGGSNQLSSNNPTAAQEVQMETGGYTA